MSYQVLARKWRPQAYAEVVGQQHVLAALASSCVQKRLHHAYLFSGSRGVGKTTLARLFAKGLNCSTGITSTPCGACTACRDIEHGRFIDMLEIDAASRTKVEDTRELLDNVQYLPISGRFKIYLIDEVHMLSRHSFNALLKTLEEPPPHVKFLLATTDPQKLPATVLSRCLQFHLQLLNVEEIQMQLQKILQLEEITAEPQALRLLARAARGSLRDALSLTDQAIAIGRGEITTMVVNQMLGTLDDQLALSLVEALQRTDATALMQIVKQAVAQGGNGEQLLSDMAAILHQVAMRQWLPDIAHGMENNQQSGAVRIQELARLIAPQDLQLYYQILLIGRKELPLAPDHRMGVEMTLLRALAFHPQAEMLPPTPPSTPSSVPSTSKPLPMMVAPTFITPNPPPSVETQGIQPTALLDAAGPSQSVLTAMSEGAQTIETTQLLQAQQQLRQQQRRARQDKDKKAPADVTAMPLATPASPTLRQTGSSAAVSAKRAVLITTDPIEVSSWPPASQSSGWPSAADVRTAMAARLAEQAALRDSWSAEVAQLMLPKLVEQLALNSVRELLPVLPGQPRQVVLHLRKAHRHLNGPAAQATLVKALSAAAGDTVAVTILEQDGSTPATLDQRTPLEWRQAIYQEQLAAAREAVLTDDNVRRLQRDFAAQLDEESIQPP